MNTIKRPAHFQRTRLGRAIGLILAGLFSFSLIEAEAEDSALDPPLMAIDPPSAAGAMPSPDYLQIALQASQQAPHLFANRLLGAPAPINVNSADGIGVSSAGAHDEATVNLGAARTTGVLAQLGRSVGFERGSVNSSALTAANANGQTGLASDGGQLNGSGVRVTLIPKAANSALITASNLTGVSAKNAGQVRLNNSTISVGGGANGINNQGLVATGAGSQINLVASEVSTLSKGSVGVLAQGGGTISISGASVISTTGASSPTSASHGLKATGNASLIAVSDSEIRTGAVAASGARADDGAQIQLQRTSLSHTSAATSTSSTAVLHALGGASINADAVTVSSSGNYIGGARAEGSASQVSLRNSSVSVKGSGSVNDFASAARAMSGGAVLIDNSTLSAEGTYSHGVSVEGSGSHANVSASRVEVGGNRAHGLYVNAGATAEISDSAIRLAPAGSAAGPWGLGALVEGSGSRLLLNDSQVHTTQKTSYGVRALGGAELLINNGLIDTQGNYSAGLSAGSSTVVARNLTVTTSGDDNAMGVVADGGANITLYGGSVTTTGNGSPVRSNLTFPHALASRNPGAVLNVYGTAVHTTGTQAYGAAVDDGGSLYLEGLSVKTEGQYSMGLYAGIGTLKPGQVSLVARNVSVETLGDQATGAMVSRQYQSDTASLQLSDSSITTRGVLSHGLQAECQQHRRHYLRRACPGSAGKQPGQCSARSGRDQHQRQPGPRRRGQERCAPRRPTQCDQRQR
jgi:hypothetical protein